MIHCETTTGLLNDIESVGKLVSKFEKLFIVDAMSSFGGIPIDNHRAQVDFLITSSNKCLGGFPGLGLVIADRESLKHCQGNAKSLVLDLYDQHQVLENTGQFRFTPPGQIIFTLQQALLEVIERGGVVAQYKRFTENYRCLVQGMTDLGFETFLPKKYHSPIITSFNPLQHKRFSFTDFYQQLKIKGYVIYNGIIPGVDCFRVGTIGAVTPTQINDFIVKVQEVLHEFNRV